MEWSELNKIIKTLRAFDSIVSMLTDSVEHKYSYSL